MEPPIARDADREQFDGRWMMQGSSFDRRHVDPSERGHRPRIYPEVGSTWAPVSAYDRGCASAAAFSRRRIRRPEGDPGWRQEAMPATARSTTPWCRT